MATAADRKRWDKLRADFLAAKADRDEIEIENNVKYGRGNQQWWPKGAKTKFEKLRDRQQKAADKFTELLVRISPRGERWLQGAPSWWLTEKLTWEDAIRPTNEPLSVVVPGSWGYPDGYVQAKEHQHMTRRVRSKRQPSLPGFDDVPDELEIRIPDMPMWTQIDGDNDPGAHGGTIARSDGDALELLKIQPVREHVGDAEAADVGFPFWTREAWFDLDDLDPKNDDVQSALSYIGMDHDGLEELTPTQRALTIASALLDYGRADEGPAGWSDDIIDHDEKVKWASGEIAGSEYLADEDDEFIREVLLDDFDVDYEKYGPDEEEPTSGLKVEFNSASWRVEITEWDDIEYNTGEEQPEGAKILKRSAIVDLDELLDPGAKHRGTYSQDDKNVSIVELAKMDSDEEREDAIVHAAIAYMAYYGGEEEYVDEIGD